MLSLRAFERVSGVWRSAVFFVLVGGIISRGQNGGGRAALVMPRPG